jgi:iron complex transport system substrate-binding protein
VILPRLALLVCLALACAAATAAATREVRDDTGATVRVPADNCRIVSLAPGTTAMLYAAGAGHCLVGTIAHSKEPAEAAKIPVVGDAETLDFENLLGCGPPWWWWPSTWCSACASTASARWAFRSTRCTSPASDRCPCRFAGLGALAATQAVADREAGRLDDELAAIAGRYRGRAPVRVLYQIWDQPIYTIGGKHVINDALTLCGASNIFADLATAAPAVTREAAVLRNPDLILVSAPPASADEWRAAWARFPALNAVRNGRVLPYTDERMDRMGRRWSRRTSACAS